MTSIGVSGNQGLPEVACSHAGRDIRTLFERQTRKVTGLSSRAVGADQLFAQLVLWAGTGCTP